MRRLAPLLGAAVEPVEKLLLEPASVLDLANSLLPFQLCSFDV